MVVECHIETTYLTSNIHMCQVISIRGAWFRYALWATQPPAPLLDHQSDYEFNTFKINSAVRLPEVASV